MRGRSKLLDFGVARLMERTAQADLTQVYGRALTPGYASPEQLKGESIAAASDVYSLGVMLYELLSRVPPRSGRAHARARACRGAAQRARRRECGRCARRRHGPHRASRQRRSRCDRAQGAAPAPRSATRARRRSRATCIEPWPASRCRRCRIRCATDRPVPDPKPLGCWPRRRPSPPCSWAWAMSRCATGHPAPAARRRRRAWRRPSRPCRYKTNRSPCCLLPT